MESKPSCLVVKFGGASLADGARISKAVGAVAREVREGRRVAVVVSATGKTTDILIDTAKQATGGELSLKELDDLLSMGERTSARIFTMALRARGVEARYFDPGDPDWPIVTDEAYTDAKLIPGASEELIKRYVSPLFDQGIVPVIPGFLGRTSEGAITTLGRGGSDTTAFIVAKALRADQTILVTSVEGIMTGDPKLVRNPRRIDEIGADTLAGLADADTKFIHKKSLMYKDASIDAKVIHFEAGSLWQEGTLIHGALPMELKVEPALDSPIMAITLVGKGLGNSPEVLREALEVLKEAGAPSLGISTNKDSLILYVPEKDPPKLVEALHSIVLKHPREAVAIAAKRGVASVKVKGVGLEDTPGVIGRIAKPLHEKSINIVGMLTITSSILVFVDWVERERTLKLMKEALEVNKEVGL